MIDTILGLAVGGITRLAPELIKLSERKSERKHEIELNKVAAEYEKARAGGEVALATPRMALDADVVATVKAAVTAQSRASGVSWVDALSASVRPVLTYGLFTLYATAKVAVFVGALKAGTAWTDAAIAAWSDADQALWSGVVNFWFLSRVFEKSDNAQLSRASEKVK